MNACLSVWGVTVLLIPARRATLYRLRLPSGPEPLLRTPRQRPRQYRWYLLSVQGAHS